MNNSQQFIAALSAADALQVLQTLAREDEKMAARMVPVSARDCRDCQSAPETD
jgi:hypothetical protein